MVANRAMVTVRDLDMTFGDRKVLHGINLNVDSGEILAIMGSSGGGKTTLLRCISGLIEPTKGEILVDNVDVTKEPEEARRRGGPERKCRQRDGEGSPVGVAEAEEEA